MSKALECAKQIKKNLSANWEELLEEHNLNGIFQGIFTLNYPIEDKNRILCYIVFAFDPESKWLDLQKDRLENKLKILNSLAADTRETLYNEILQNTNEIVNMCIFNFLEDLKNWKWRVIYDLLDWASKMQNFATQETEAEKTYQKQGKEGEVRTITSDVDIEIITKVNREKGVLLKQAIEKRREADELLKEIEKDFASTDGATQGDFGFTFSATAKKKNILSWREYITEKKRLKPA